MADKQSAKPQAATGGGRFAYNGLDRTLHEKARLGIITSLAMHPRGLLFNDLKTLCNLTDGNLNRHLAVLVEAGMVDVEKAKRATLYRMTRHGRQRLMEYIGELEQVVRDVETATRHAQERPEKGSVTPA